MKIERIHHVAYRCRDAKETVEWYRRHLGMEFVLAIAEDQVPSTHAPDPYMHLFMDAGNGNVLAFFELPNSKPMGRDPNTPDWVQHIAFKVGSVKELEQTKAHPGGRHHRPHHLQVDLLLRPQRPPAGTGCRHRHARHVPTPRRREVGDARRVVEDQTRAEARALDA
jgi:catechol 2,3-dioxygenase-like lactoylglutathione lyase family enzyme